MKRAIFPGTFDPFTIGHESIVKRALTFMDEVVVGIGINEAKNTHFTVEKRLDAYDTLTVDFATQMDAKFMIRGIRTVKDFEYEESIADINRRLAGIETILLFTEPELSCISSTLVRDLLSFKKEITQFIPKGMKL